LSYGPLFVSFSYSFFCCSSSVVSCFIVLSSSQSFLWFGTFSYFLSLPPSSLSCLPCSPPSAGLHEVAGCQPDIMLTEFSGCHSFRTLNVAVIFGIVCRFTFCGQCLK
jgi:hypothetical protein